MNLTDWMIRNLDPEVIGDNSGLFASVIESGLAIAFNEGAALAAEVGADAAFERNPYFRGGA